MAVWSKGHRYAPLPPALLSSVPQPSPYLPWGLASFLPSSPHALVPSYSHPLPAGQLAHLPLLTYPANALAKIACTSDSGSRPAGGTSMDVKSAAFAVPAACTAERNPSSKRA